MRVAKRDWLIVNGSNFGSNQPYTAVKKLFVLEYKFGFSLKFRCVYYVFLSNESLLA